MRTGRLELTSSIGRDLSNCRCERLPKAGEQGIRPNEPKVGEQVNPSKRTQCQRSLKFSHPKHRQPLFVAPSWTGGCASGLFIFKCQRPLERVCWCSPGIRKNEL